MARATYTTMVQHYGEAPQEMSTFKTKALAEKYCNEQYEICKGYNKSYGILENYGNIDKLFIIFDNEGNGTFATKFWVRKSK